MEGFVESLEVVDACCRVVEVVGSDELGGGETLDATVDGFGRGAKIEKTFFSTGGSVMKRW